MVPFTPIPGSLPGFSLRRGSGMPDELPKAAVTVKPASARTYETWLSLAKSHCPLKYIVPTGSGSEQYQLINVVDKRHA